MLQNLVSGRDSDFTGRQGYRGQRRLKILGDLPVVKSCNGNISRNLQARVIQGMDSPSGHEIVHGKDSGGTIDQLQQFLRFPVTGIIFPISVTDKPFWHGQPRLLHGLLISVHAFACGVGMRVASDHGNPAMPLGNEKTGHIGRCGLIIIRYEGILLIAVGIGKYQRFIHRIKKIIQMPVMHTHVNDTNLQVITPALSLTKGGPGTGSYYMCYMLYNKAFNSHQYGYGSAIAVILFILIAIFTAILFSTSNGWIFYEGDEKE